MANDGMTVSFELGDRTIARQALADCDHEVGADRSSELLQRVERRPSTAAFEPGNGRLCRPHEFGQLRLSEAGLGPDPIDEVSECSESLLLPACRVSDAALGS